jgi:hypothetical protein
MKSCFKKLNSKSWDRFLEPLLKILPQITPLVSIGDRPLQMTFEDQLRILIYYHLGEYTSGRHLLQALEEDQFAKTNIAPEKGIAKSSFFEAMSTRGLEQLMQVFEGLKTQASSILNFKKSDMGNLIAIDGSLIDGVLSMDWASYRKDNKKAKAHIGFNINKGIPCKAFVSNGNKAERPFVSQILQEGETAIMDRGYQCNKNFDLLQDEGKFFICRIKKNTTKRVISSNSLPKGSLVFYDSIVSLGSEKSLQTKRDVRLISYTIEGVEYWIATNRFDLKADQIAEAYRLRWQVESFFAWWKRHLSVYHILARSEYGLKVQIFAGLITYLLLAIHCHQQHGEKVTIKRVRELRNRIINESRENNREQNLVKKKKNRSKKKRRRKAKT